MKITPSLQMALHLHNAGIANARADYYAHPSEFNKARYCVDCSLPKGPTTKTLRCFDCHQRHEKAKEVARAS